MIERAITENDIKSEYYQAHETIAQLWEDYAIKNNGKIEGIVNSYIVEVKLLFARNGKSISIESLRQLTNTNSLLKKAPIIKNTSIEIKPIRIQKDSWTIKKRGESKNIFTLLFKSCKPYVHDSDYDIISRSRINDNLIFDRELWKLIKDLSDLEEITYKKETLKIESINLIFPEKIELLIKALQEKYGI